MLLLIQFIAIMIFSVLYLAIVLEVTDSILGSKVMSMKTRYFILQIVGSIFMAILTVSFMTTV